MLLTPTPANAGVITTRQATCSGTHIRWSSVAPPPTPQHRFQSGGCPAKQNSRSPADQCARCEASSRQLSTDEEREVKLQRLVEVLAVPRAFVDRMVELRPALLLQDPAFFDRKRYAVATKYSVSPREAGHMIAQNPQLAFEP